MLVSGRGTNLASLLSAVREGHLDAEIVRVVSNKPDAPALDVARRAGVDALAVPSAGATRDDHERAMMQAIDAARPDLVLLAGYMRVLGAAFIQRYRGRMLNIHPSLLPAFPGLDAVGQAHARRVRIAGCTTHFVTEDVDAGPIVGQAALVVDPAWSAEELRARILELEHALYPASVALVASGAARLEGDRVVFRDAPREGALLSLEAPR